MAAPTRSLPVDVTTRSGDRFAFRFPLHSETGDALRVRQTVDALLAVIDRDLAVLGEMSNGDVLQALAMAMAVRARIVHAPPETTARLAEHLLHLALHAADEAEHHPARAGRA